MSVYVETIITFLGTLPWWGILVFAIFITFIENIFPPSPSDILLVFIGTLVGLGTVDFLSALLCSTLGSMLGFIVMYAIGARVDSKVIESGKWKFIPIDSLHVAEKWFQKWGYWVIVANRFLSGTRAVIAFFAGMSQLQKTKTYLLSAISALIWNGILLYVGSQFGSNWQLALEYINKYSTIVTYVCCAVVVCGCIYWLWQKRKPV